MHMKLTASILALFLATSFMASGPAQSTRAADTPSAEVSGEVALFQGNAPAQGTTPVGSQGNSTRASDASRVVVWLVPLEPAQRVRTSPEKTHYRLVQRNKRFEPGLLVIPVGSVVDFPNADPWFHNVFSLYRGKRFDLGLYQAGAQRSVRFDRPGPSYLFCNIHPEMTGVVLAIDSDLYGLSDKSGHYAIPSVPPGKYLVRVWYENARPETLQELQRTVTLESGNRALSLISVPVIAQLQSEHKNKYGQDYDPDSLKSDY
jgi:plastocyanin